MKKYNPEIHKRHSIRLKDFDYSQGGLYFITICCKNKAFLFGGIDNSEMKLNEIGKIVEQVWKNTPNVRDNIILHSFVVMPNHFHAIVEIVAEFEKGELRFAPTGDMNKFKGTSNTIGAIVRGFKIAVIKNVKLYLLKNPNIEINPLEIWQRNYHEHIIRNEKSYNQICEYIENNPINWQNDCYFS